MVAFDVAPLAYDQVEQPEWIHGYRPYRYQWDAFCLVREALDSRRTLCLFLVTPTGSGKTLGAYAYSIISGEPIIGAYPTNELLADQERALIPEFQYTRSNRVFRVDSAALDRWQTDFDLKRHSETLEVILNYEPILLTNPDILFYLAFGLYPTLPGLRERLWTLMGRYRLFAFDEFHLYNIKQQADVAFLIGAMNAIKPDFGRVYILASATPDLEMVTLLREKMGLWVEVLEAQPSAFATARTVAHPLHLSVLPANLDRWQGLAALEENWGEVERLRREYPGACWVAVFDSVAAAIQAAQRFRRDFGHDRVGEVHGLSSEQARSEALAKTVTVGTSTIEVGVDFKGLFEKDILLFEARTSSQFLQRLGRLARHAKSLPIPNQAFAFAPEYVCNFLREQIGAATEVSRQRLRMLIEDAYQQPETFQRFRTQHAAVEMAEAVQLALGMFQPDDRPRIEAGLNGVIEGLTGHTLRQAQGQRRRYKEEEILPPLLTFRGAGMEVAILDARSEDVGSPAKRYDVTFLLRRGEYEELSEETYRAELEQLKSIRVDWFGEVSREQRYDQKIAPAPDKLLGVFGFFRLTDILDEARRVWFEIDEDDIRGKLQQVTVLEGLSLVTEPPAPTRLLNHVLNRKRIVAWVTDSPPSTIKFGRALPPLFAVYDLYVNLPGGGRMSRPWSIAFNQDAFFLSSLWWRKSASNDAIII